MVITKDRTNAEIVQELLERIIAQGICMDATGQCQYVLRVADNRCNHCVIGLLIAPISSSVVQRASVVDIVAQGVHRMPRAVEWIKERLYYGGLPTAPPQAYDENELAEHVLANHAWLAENLFLARLLQVLHDNTGNSISKILCNFCTEEDQELPTADQQLYSLAGYQESGRLEREALTQTVSRLAGADLTEQISKIYKIHDDAAE